MAKSTKKVVKVESSGDAKSTKGKEAVWTPSAESKAKATKFRIIAAVLWVVAIAAEAFAIFWLLPRIAIYSWSYTVLIILLVVIAILAIGGSLLWKKANRHDPASNKDKVRFFIQNQLGLIISIIAFLPLIILIFMNKDMDGKQKGIAGTVAIVLLVVAGAFGIDWNAPSQEEYDTNTSAVVALTGADEVFWVKGGDVYHLCKAASAVQKDSKDGKIYSGTTQAAVEAGKSRLTKQLQQEVNECGIDQQKLDDWNKLQEGKTIEPAPEETAEDSE